MKPLVNIKIKRIAEGHYRGFSEELQELSVEGATVWEALTLARREARKIKRSRRTGQKTVREG
jgi:hypothetical protein